jgi:predicted signal transduction protein with EAL and GGDEF domain
MTTTAEGVETEAQMELPRTLGCTEMQAICSALRSRPRKSDASCSARRGKMGRWLKA